MQPKRLDSSLSQAVVLMFRVLNRAYNRRCAALGLTVEQAHIIGILDELGPITIGQLQKTLGLSSATMTGALDRMEQSDLIRRIPSKVDRRAVLIECLAPPKLRRAIDKVIEDGERELFGALQRGQREELLALLKICISNLEAEAS